MADIDVSNHGCFYVITGRTDRGAKWCDENLVGEQTPACGGIACEGRYVVDIVEGARADGLVIS